MLNYQRVFSIKNGVFAKEYQDVELSPSVAQRCWLAFLVSGTLIV
jgi:hypothetical protein